MTEETFKEQQAEIARGELDWYYLSYANDERFLGGVMIHAFGPADAVAQSGARSLIPIPRCSVMVMRKPSDEPAPPPEMVNRLLSEAEIRAFFGNDDVASLGEMMDRDAALAAQIEAQRDKIF
jgi:hypothetical protein